MPHFTTKLLDFSPPCSSQAFTDENPVGRMNRRHWLNLAVRRSTLICNLAIVGTLPGCFEPTRPLANDRVLQKVWGQRGLSDGRFQKPRAMTIDAKDQLYIVDMTGRIQVFDADGNYLRGWHTPAIDTGKPTGLGIDSKGRIMVADTHYYRVLFYSPEGDLDESRTIGGVNGQGPGQFGFVTDAIQDRHGNYYVSEYGEFDRVQKFNADREFICQFGKHGSEPGEFSRPQCLGLDLEGSIWVADACNHRIQVFRCEHDKPELISVIGTPGKKPGQFSYPYSFLLDGQDLLYVCEFGNQRIQKMTRAGQPISTWGSGGHEIGQLHQPWAIVQDSKKRVHILDTSNHRVQRILL